MKPNFSFLVCACAVYSLTTQAEQHDAEEILASFRVPDGFRVELVASEPDVVDPVAMAFDEGGRLYVVEMRGYPNAGVAEGTPKLAGRIRLLDRPRGTRFTRSTVFADGLAFPTSVLPYKRGVLITCAPDIFYFEDTDNDGQADIRRVLYTGFGLKNIQALTNSLQWGLDNYVHGAGASNGGEIRSAEKLDAPTVTLGSRNFRFRPDTPASFETTSASSQFGLTTDDFGHWFTCNNSQHILQVPVETRYLSRQPFLLAPPLLPDISNHGGAAQLFRRSPFEPWRVERTTRRANAPDATRFPKTELVAGGFITSASGLTVYRANRFPVEYYGNTFVCDSANNLIHRDVLESRGVLFTARRAENERDREFLASSHPRFRPVNLAIGPDGALYVADFPREVIETPLSLPDDIKAKSNLESMGLGRIWRITTQSSRSSRQPQLGRASSRELVKQLENPNSWWRITAQRLLVQSKQRNAAPALRALLRNSKVPVARLHSLCTLDGLGALDDESLAITLKDSEEGVRARAVLLAESRPALGDALLALANDPSPHVRFQLALSLGELRVPRRLDALAALARRDSADPYQRAAILSSIGDDTLTLLTLSMESDPVFRLALARIIGTRRNPDEIAEILTRITSTDVASLQNLALGIRQRGSKPITLPTASPAADALRRFLASDSDAIRNAANEVAGLVRVFGEDELATRLKLAASVLPDETKPLPDRVAAAQDLAAGKFADFAPTLVGALAPRQPEPLQVAALDALDAFSDPKVATAITDRWAQFTPALRARAIVIILKRKERIAPLLDALEYGAIPRNALDSAQRALLTQSRDAAIVERAKQIFAASKRDTKLADSLKAVLSLEGDVRRGEKTFQARCTSCHAASNAPLVGPSLASVRNNPPDQILKNIADPNLAVLPQFVQYLAETNDGEMFNGIIVAETDQAITLRRPGASDRTLLRRDLRGWVSSRVSLMPEGLLDGLAAQDIADLLEFVRQIK